MDKKEKTQRAKEELDVLTGVIDYADRMIYEEGKRGEYGSLRRHAYGKTVVINTEKLGRLTFRLSSASAVYPNSSSGYATPYSPVGRLCSILQAGDKRDSPRWGEYTVSEVRLFERFDGAAFEFNVRNFLRMALRQQQEKDEVTNLRAFLSTKPEISNLYPSKTKKTDEALPTSPPAPSQLPIETPPSDESETPNPHSISFTVYAIDEESSEDGWILSDQEEDDEDRLSQPSTVDEYFGLSETFYLDRTHQQDKVISRSPIGAMYVEGVAGSGKTSAALGRTKMLCDYNAQNVYQEAEFRDIVGEEADYWSDKFAGQFSQESSIGFVRTGELIQYLKETCRRLDLPNLPVQEYPELRSRLRQFRQLERAGKGLRRWSGLDEPRNTYVETTMAWLRSADRSIAQHWAQAFVSSISPAEDLVQTFKSEVRQQAAGPYKLAMARAQDEIAIICQTLVKPREIAPFALDGLANRINNCINNIRTEVLGRDILWIGIGDRYWYARSERELAKQLIADKVALYSNTSARLVFFDKEGPLDNNLKLLSMSGEVLLKEQVTQQQLSNKPYLVSDEVTGETLPAMTSDIDDLYLRLLQESANKLYVLQNNRLKRLAIQRGLGQLSLPITPSTQSMKKEPDDGTNEPETLPEKNRTVAAVFTAAMRRALLQPLEFISDAYSEALAANPSLFPDEKVAVQIASQLKNRKLTHEDVDLLLCLCHVIGRGFEGTPHQLGMPPLYQSVFIDEVQDFTEQQVYLMAEQARPEYFAVTVVGDPAQKLHNGSRIDVPSCFPGKALEKVQLSKNMRQSEAPGIAWFSARFRLELQRSGLGEIPDDELIDQLINAPDDVKGPELLHFEEQSQLIEQTIALLKQAKPMETAVVILPTPELATQIFEACKPRLAEEMIDAELSENIDLSRRHVRHFTSITNTKGLEFDLVILPYLEQYDLMNDQHKNQLYVGLTRAKRRLVLIGCKNSPPSIFAPIWQQYQAILAMAH